jgi:hypothetical protein
MDPVQGANERVTQRGRTTGNGCWLVSSTGHVYSFGDAANFGSPGPQGAAVTAAVQTKDGGGYWVTSANGSVYTYGDARGLLLADLPNAGVAIWMGSD